MPVTWPNVAGGSRKPLWPNPGGVFGWIGVVVVRWPWAVIGFWIALAAVSVDDFPSLTEMAERRPVAILPPDAPVLADDTTDLRGVSTSPAPRTKTFCWWS